MTVSISRPVPVSFFLQHLTEFGDEADCIVAFMCCPFCSWKLNAVPPPDWSDKTTGWCYQQHIHSKGIKLQCGLFANAWFFCVSQTCCCWCNWNQHHVNEMLYPPLLCLSKTGHSLVNPCIVQGFCWVCVIACLYVTVCDHMYTQTCTKRHSLQHIYGF